MQNRYNSLADMNKLVWVIDRYRRIRFAVLFFSLLLSIALIPLFVRVHFRIVTAFLEIFIGTALLAALFSIVGRHSFRLIAGIVLPFIVISTLRLFSLPIAPVLAADILWIAFASLSIALILRHVMKVKRVSADVIFAALSTYLLFGLVFGVIYSVLEQIWPGSLLSTHSVPGVTPIGQATYFSFVTLATLGYGDVVPRSSEIRALAIVETICGQVYLTVLVARLVGLYSRKED